MVAPTQWVATVRASSTAVLRRCRLATGEAGLVVGERVTATVEQNTMCHNGGSGCVFGDRAGGLLHGNSLTHNAMLGLMVSGLARPDCRENSLQHNQQGGVDADSLDFLAEVRVCLSTQPLEPTTTVLCIESSRVLLPTAGEAAQLHLCQLQLLRAGRVRGGVTRRVRSQSPRVRCHVAGGRPHSLW